MFKPEKIAVSLMKLPGPSHQSALRMSIHMLTVLLTGKFGIKHELHCGGFKFWKESEA